jgi:hypothetical protein
MKSGGRRVEIGSRTRVTPKATVKRCSGKRPVSRPLTVYQNRSFFVVFHLGQYVCWEHASVEIPHAQGKSHASQIAIVIVLTARYDGLPRTSRIQFATHRNLLGSDLCAQGGGGGDPRHDAGRGFYRPMRKIAHLDRKVLHRPVGRANLHRWRRTADVPEP